MDELVRPNVARRLAGVPISGKLREGKKDRYDRMMKFIKSGKFPNYKEINEKMIKREISGTPDDVLENFNTFQMEEFSNVLPIERRQPIEPVNVLEDTPQPGTSDIRQLLEETTQTKGKERMEDIAPVDMSEFPRVIGAPEETDAPIYKDYTQTSDPSERYAWSETTLTHDPLTGRDTIRANLEYKFEESRRYARALLPDASSEGSYIPRPNYANVTFDPENFEGVDMLESDALETFFENHPALTYNFFNLEQQRRVLNLLENNIHKQFIKKNLSPAIYDQLMTKIRKVKQNSTFSSTDGKKYITGNKIYNIKNKGKNKYITEKERKTESMTYMKDRDRLILKSY